MITSRQFMEIATDGGRLEPGHQPETRPTHPAFWSDLSRYGLQRMRGEGDETTPPSTTVELVG